MNPQTFLTKNGYVEIGSLKVGDKVIGQDGKENEVLEIRQFDRAWFQEQEILDQYNWYHINGEYQLFGTQNIYVAEGDYTVCHVSELKVGWKIYNENGDEIEIESIDIGFNISDPWYKLVLDGDHSYMGNGLLLHNASRFWRGGGLTANWNAVGNTNWSATSGGANNASVPGATDDATLDGGIAGNGNSNGTISAVITVLSITFTANYTSTVTRNAVLTVAGNVTLDTATVWAGASGLTISAASTIVWGGVTWNTALNFGAGAKIFNGNGAVSGLFTSTAAHAINVTVAETFTLSGGMTTTGQVSGTVKLVWTAGTWQGAASINNNLDIQGNVVFINGGTCIYGTGIMTYVSGTPVTTGNTLKIASTTVQLNVAQITFNNVSGNDANTVTATLLADLNMSGNFTAGTNTTAVHTWNGAFNINVGGNWSMTNMTSGTIIGTATVVMTGASPTISMPAITSGSIRTNVTIAISGTITLTGNPVFSTTTGGFRFFAAAAQTITWTITSGAITVSDRFIMNGGSAAVINITCNTASITFAQIQIFSNALSYTLNFNGTQGFTIGTMRCMYSASGIDTTQVVLKVGNTYTISTNFFTDITTILTTQINTTFLFKSDTPGSQATLTLAAAASQNLFQVNFTDTKSLAQTIFSFHSTLSNVTNIISTPTAPTSVGSGY